MNPAFRRRPSSPLGVTLLLLAVHAADGLAANRLEVSPRTFRVGDAVEITVTLEGDAARVDEVDLGLQNLRIESGPSVSSRFSWTNGVTAREKSFRYSAEAVAPGRAVVGPVRAGAAVIPPVVVQVLPPIGDNVDGPDEMMGLLGESGRDGTFILAESEKESATVGEPLIVTWSLFTDELVSDLDVSSVPALADFWSEELPLNEEPTRDVIVGGRRLRKIPVRRAALFPLRAGELTVGPLVTRAAVMRPFGSRSSPFSALNQEIVTLTLRAPARRFSIRPLPNGDVDGVGELTLRCSAPEVVPDGPVAIAVVLSGAGNLRAAGRPHFEGGVAGRVEFVEGEVKVDRRANALSMSRDWRVLLFPGGSGVLEIPPIIFRAYVPSRDEVVTLRCPPAKVRVQAVPPQPPESLPPTAGAQRPPMRTAPILVGLVFLGVGTAVVLAFLRWRPRVREDEVDRVLSHFQEPRVMRMELYELVAERGLSAESLLREPSERGDSFRAVQSLIDIAEKETLTGNVTRQEMRRRLETFLRDIAKT